MAKVVHIREVPDDVHAALVEAADAQGLSLTRYLRGELERLSHQPRVHTHNSDVIDATQAAVGTTVGNDEILRALDEGRNR